MKTYLDISYPSKVRFRKKVHSQASDHVWFFLNLFSKRPREKKEKERKKVPPPGDGLAPPAQWAAPGDAGAMPMAPRDAGKKGKGYGPMRDLPMPRTGVESTLRTKFG